MGPGTASARDSRSWGQGINPQSWPGPSCHPHAHRRPAELWANVPAHPRCAGPCCPAAGGAAPPGGRLLQLCPQLLGTHLHLCNLNLRQFGNVNDGCHGLRGSSRARGAQGTLWRVKGVGGLEPGRVVAPGLSQARGRLVISLPYWSHWGDCNSSQGRGCSAQPSSTGCGPAQPHAFPTCCLSLQASWATLAIAVAPLVGTALGHSPDRAANAGSPQSSSVPRCAQSHVPVGKPCTAPRRMGASAVTGGSLPPTLPCSTALSVAWPRSLGL